MDEKGLCNGRVSSILRHHPITYFGTLYANSSAMVVPS